MKILIVGKDYHQAELKEKFGDDHEYTLADGHDRAKTLLDKNDLVFDFIMDELPNEIKLYAERKITVFINTSKISLQELASTVNNKVASVIFGFNGMPTLFNRAVLEVSLWQHKDESTLAEVCKNLNTEYAIVDDRVGMVTPRVIAMIINEAYYTVQEGTATKEDIDLAMKLGTNYPHGPFEWCNRIGLKHIYELLDAVYRDTRDERYKICPLLKREYLQASNI